jgi:hypothetical protein
VVRRSAGENGYAGGTGGLGAGGRGRTSQLDRRPLRATPCSAAPRF